VLPLLAPAPCRTCSLSIWAGWLRLLLTLLLVSSHSIFCWASCNFVQEAAAVLLLLVLVVLI
jgi:hypothetical protein